MPSGQKSGLYSEITSTYQILLKKEVNINRGLTQSAGNSYYTQGKYGRALNCYRLLVSGTPPCLPKEVRNEVISEKYTGYSSGQLKGKADYWQNYFLFSKGKRDEAISGFNQILSGYPQMKEAGSMRYLLASYYLGKKNVERAKKEIKLAKALFPNDNLIISLEKKVVELSKKFADIDKQITEQEKITVSKGKEADKAQLKIGTLYLEKEDYKNALIAFEKVAKDFPESSFIPEAQFQAAKIYGEKLNNKEKMKKMLEEIMSKYPEHKVSFKALEIIRKEK